MARVVQRRSGPPYLLILCSFAFLAATTLAVLFYTRQADARQAKAELEEQLNKIADASDRDASYVKERMRVRAARPRSVDYKVDGKIDSELEAQWARSVPVVSRLEQHLRDLAKEANPGSDVEGDVIAVAIQAYNALRSSRQYVRREAAKDLVGGEAVEGVDNAMVYDGWGGVLPELKLAYAQRLQPQREIADTLVGALADTRKENARLDQKIEQASSAAARWQQQYTQTNKLLEEKVNALNTAEQKVAARDAQIRRQKEELNDLQSKLDAKGKTVTKLATKIDELVEVVKQQRRELNQQKVRERVRVMRTRPDGEIISVDTEQNTCQINVGLEQGVTVRSTFSVYPSSGIPVPPEPKGKIEVVRASENSSICKIIEQSSTDPVGQDDKIANIAFDAKREYKFVVAGHFDLFDTGHPSAKHRQEVKMLIQRFGGQVVDEITPDVDYLVLGKRPQVPPRPESPMPEEEEDRYRTLQEQADRFDTVQRQAKEIGIWILSTNRFLDLVGYTPTQQIRRR